MWTNNLASLGACSDQMSWWLIKPYNLGDALRKVCKEISLKIIDLSLNQPFDDELTILKLESASTQTCYLRHTLLQGDAKPFSFGRVVVPEKVYRNHQAAFDNLQSRLIGETMLYNDESIIRNQMEYNLIEPSHPLFRLMQHHFPEQNSSFWARRSRFFLNENEILLITEVFFHDFHG